MFQSSYVQYSARLIYIIGIFLKAVNIFLVSFFQICFRVIILKVEHMRSSQTIPLMLMNF